LDRGEEHPVSQTQMDQAGRWHCCRAGLAEGIGSEFAFASGSPSRHTWLPVGLQFRKKAGVFYRRVFLTAVVAVAVFIVCSSARHIAGAAVRSSPLVSLTPSALQRDRLFRQQVGLRSDSAWINAVSANPAASSREYGVPLLPAEVRQLTLRAAAGRQIPRWAAEARRLFPGSFAGIYMNQRAGGVISIGFTRDAAVRARLILAGSRIPARIRIVTARYALARLQAVQRRIDARLSGLAHLGLSVSQTSLDLPANAVLVGLANYSAANARFLRRTFGPAVHVIQLTVLPAIDTTIRVPPMKGGLDINSHIGSSYYDCTGGFDATDRSFGYNVLITAGHCGGDSNQTGSYWYQGWFEYPLLQSNGRNGLGTMIHNSFSSGNNGDAASITLPANDRSNLIYEPGGSNYQIVGVDSSDYVGETICKTGIATGYTCGQITTTDATINYQAEHVTLYDMREADNYAYSGDSGSPVTTTVDINEVRAAGVLSGITCASSTCSTGNVTGTIYSWIGNAESYANASVNT
jgi:streptogrisin C